MPLNREALRRSLPPPWTQIEVVDRLASTNRAMLERPDTWPPNSVLVAEHQVAGRGRLNRAWVTPARSALTFSVSLRPTPPAATWGWLPLLAGVALRDSVVSATGITAALKWPNDLLLGPDGRKAAGILTQAVGDTVVLGIGLNVSTTADELPGPTATSLELAGAVALDRTALLLTVLTQLGQRYLSWQSADGNAKACELALDYRTRCLTLGQWIIVTGVGRAERHGRAVAIDGEGRLVIEVDGRPEIVAAGDVVHVRSQPDVSAKPGHSG